MCINFPISVTQTCDFGMPFLFNNLLTILRRGCTFQKLQSMKTAGFEQPNCQGLLRCPWWIYQTSELEVDDSIFTINHHHTPFASLHNSYSSYCILFCSIIVTVFISFPQSTSCFKCLYLSSICTLFICWLGLSSAVFMYWYGDMLGIFHFSHGPLWRQKAFSPSVA